MMMGGCYSRRMPVIWDPFGTSCSLKQVLSSQQLTGFYPDKVPTVFFAEKDAEFLLICQKSISGKKVRWADYLIQIALQDWETRTQDSGWRDSSSVCRKSTELAWPGGRCCFPSSSLDTGWLIPLCVWFPSRFRPTREILLVLVLPTLRLNYSLCLKTLRTYYLLRTTKDIVYTVQMCRSVWTECYYFFSSPKNIDP